MMNCSTLQCETNTMIIGQNNYSSVLTPKEHQTDLRWLRDIVKFSLGDSITDTVEGIMSASRNITQIAGFSSRMRMNRVVEMPATREEIFSIFGEMVYFSIEEELEAKRIFEDRECIDTGIDFFEL